MTQNDVDALREQWGYKGKPKQWQDGFDAGMKELTEALAGRWKDEDMMAFVKQYVMHEFKGMNITDALAQFKSERGIK